MSSTISSGPAPEFYTVSEISQQLKLHENTVRAAIKSGNLPHVRLGVGKLAHIRIPRAAFEAWVSAQLEAKK